VYEDILITLIWGYKAITFGVVKPLNYSSDHICLLWFYYSCYDVVFVVGVLTDALTITKINEQWNRKLLI
jgi:hypothetical protein